MSRKIIAIMLAVICLMSLWTKIPVQAASAADPESGQEPGGTSRGSVRDPGSASQGTGKEPGDSAQDPGKDDPGITGDGDQKTPSSLVIDNQNIYEGMDRPYSEGYGPKVENGWALVVVPMVLQGEEESALKGDTLRVSLDLGDSGNSPFVYRNYEKNIPLQDHPVNQGTGTVKSFVASFWLELLPERFNGNYPVTLAVEGTDTKGNVVSQNFVVYVTISDGKDPNAKEPEPEPEPEPEEPPAFAPKLLVQSCRYSKDEILAGDEVTAEITLLNTSKSQEIKNMTITVSLPAEQMTLESPSDSVYIESVKAGETCTITFACRVNAAAPEGQYDLALAMDYADEKGNTYSGSGKARMWVKQPLNLQFDPISLPETMEVGDVAQLQLQAMNLGRSKVYHVRAELAADGLTPQGTIFIGDIEAGAMAVGSTQISVGGMSEGDSLYGNTKGIVTFYYEDESGNEQTRQMEFSTTIASPFTDQPQEEEDEPGQWWVIIVMILVLLCFCGGFLAFWKIREKKRRAEDQ